MVIEIRMLSWNSFSRKSINYLFLMDESAVFVKNIFFLVFFTGKYHYLWLYILMWYTFKKMIQNFFIRFSVESYLNTLVIYFYTRFRFICQQISLPLPIPSRLLQTYFITKLWQNFSKKNYRWNFINLAI